MIRGASYCTECMGKSKWDEIEEIDSPLTAKSVRLLCMQKDDESDQDRGVKLLCQGPAENVKQEKYELPLILRKSKFTNLECQMASTKQSNRENIFS